MITKLSVLLLLFALPAASFGQALRIDSIAVNEDKGELVLHGLFTNSSQAVLTVDSFSLPITVASDTLIRATIPDSGKGSAGWVEVDVMGNKSNKKLLTYFHFEVYERWMHGYSDGGLEFEHNDLRIHTRGDILGFSMSGTHTLNTSNLSKYHIVASGNNGIVNGQVYKYYGAHYDSTVALRYAYSYDAKNREFQIWIYIPDIGDIYQRLDDVIVKLDGNYEVIHEIQIPFGTATSCDYAEDGPCSSTNAIAPTDFPPSTAEVLKQSSTPTILQARISSDPVAANAKLIITLGEDMNVRMEIMDILGNMRYSDERRLSAGENKLPFNTSELAAGIYICRIQTIGQVQSIRFVKN